MLTFDFETRQFTSVVSEEDRAYAVDWKALGDTAKKVGSQAMKGAGVAAKKGGHILRSSTGNQWALAGAGINMYRNNKKRQELQARYEAQGKSPEEARKLAKKQTSGMVASAAKGAIVGGMARKVAGAAGLKQNAADLRLNRMKTIQQTRNQVDAIKQANALKEAKIAGKQAIKDAKKGKL